MGACQESEICGSHLECNNGLGEIHHFLIPYNIDFNLPIPGKRLS